MHAQASATAGTHSTPPALASLGGHSDEAIMRACRGAETEQARRLVGELARRHLERLATFLFGITKDRSGSLDLAQEAFVRVFKHRENYKDLARFSTWLYTIGRNLALNELRNRQRRPNLLGGGGDDSGEQDPLAGFAAAGGDPQGAAQQSDVQRVVRAAIEELSETYRSVVILCDLQELQYAEAAEILGVPIGTVRSRLSRARGQLADRLRGQVEGL